MSLDELLGRIVERLEAAGIPYMVAGSLASSFHGVPRSTQDLDLVIDPTANALESLLEALPAEDYYVSREAARAALAQRGQFNLVDQRTGWKVDLIIRKDRPFSAEEFRRRREDRIADLRVFVASPEDTILAKLEWSLLGESERQLRDVAGVISIRGEKLDLDYIERWAAALGLRELWRRARDLAEELSARRP